MMYCTQCGNALSDVDRFCSKCGKAVSSQMLEEGPISTSKDSPPVAPAPQPSPTEVSLAADPDFLKSFANSLAISIWWKTSLALLIPGLILAVSEMNKPGATNAGLFISFTIILYLLATAYAPYQTLKSLTGKQLSVSSGHITPSGRVSKGFTTRNGSIEIHPTPVTNNDYIALTWGFIWRLTVVSMLLALPFQLSGYAPDEIEQLFVSIVLLLLACWLASLWLVFTPYGKCRFHTVLSESGQNGLH